MLWGVWKRVIWLAVLATSCKDRRAQPPPPEPVGLELASSGVLPRAPLRYALAKGTTSALAFDITSHVAAGEQADASPPIHVALDVAVTNVFSDGRMQLALTIRSLGATGDDPTAMHVDSLGSAFAGLSMVATLAPDGTISDIETKSTPGFDALEGIDKAAVAQIASAFRQLAMPLPSVPVGIGATWTTTRPLAANPVAMTATTTVVLTGRTGSAITYAITSELHGADQTTVQDGTSVEVAHISGSASGNGTLDLAKFAVDSTQSAELHMNMTTGSDRTAMTMRQVLRVSSH
jgi:hypothetical protein